ncbi:molybdopterin-dependent oxidoreductase [Candidatus Poribacteria bacterium]|nr:molybdopterin-dependent oxidoreductase [Candidatus Poribacteria bacterium]
MVNLTIDDKKVSVHKGTTILKAAESVGIYIPTLCYHPKLSSIGACRVCLVEVEGESRAVASCDVQAREGMVVRTNTDEIVRQRKQMLQFVLLNHPLDCPVCDKSGECDVQDITVEMCILQQPFWSVKPEKSREELSPVLDIWHTRCIMCGRCVQVCKEIQGARAIDCVVRSGYSSKVGPTQFGGYPCESCSQCLSVCPVGAILDSTFRYSARAWQLKPVDAVCTFCGIGCSYELNVRGDKVYRVTVRDFQGHNKGNLCSVGRFGRDAAHSESRLTSPAIRNNGSVRNTTWDEALGLAAEKLREIAKSAGNKSVAGLASARCSNEALFAFQRLMREGLGTNRLDTPARLNNLAIIETMTDVYGVAAPTATLSDIDNSDVILVFDSNIICTHPVAALEALRVHASGSAKVLVVGHRSNKLTTQCTQFARTMPGAEAAVLNCLANLLVEKGSLDGETLERRTDGYNKLKLHLAKYSLADVSASTGVDAAILSEMAAAIGNSKNLLLMLSPGSLHSAVNSSIVRAAVNLAVLKGGKTLSLMREGNAQGALDMGVTPAFLPGHKEASEAGNGPLEVAGILRGIESGEVKALYLMGGDIRKEMALLGLSLDVLRTLELLVVQDVFGGPVAEMANVVLPACSFAEQDASYTNAYRITQHSNKAIRPMGECRTDLEILSELGHKLGLPSIESLESVRNQIAAAAPNYGFMKGSARLAQAETWDYSKVASSGRHKLSLVKESQAAVDAAYPYIISFDNMLHYGGAASLHSASLARIRVDGVVEIGEDDARNLGVKNGNMVELAVKGGGSLKLRARISRELPAGVLGIPAHDLAVVSKLVKKLEASALKAEEGAPVWVASVRMAKD